ncbi:hypothetical protein [Peristeroidobacter agariperforans]|uniref:hypothetical protein n=1 Tax=Peristeroidobacter agariperforans TaxID=268404 RepID=UPI00101C03B7|nr:hypothetical protein [Peristeroidobacter agariperforans]
MTSPNVPDELRSRRLEKLWAKASKLRRMERDALIEREAKNDYDRRLLLDRSEIEGADAP